MVPLMLILAGLGQGASSASGRFHHHAAAMLEAVAAEAPPAEAQVLRELAASERGVADGEQRLQPVCFVRNGYAVLANDRLGLLFRLRPDPPQLRALYHVPGRYQFVRWADGPRPLWEVAYWDPQDRNAWQEILDSTQPAQVSWQTGETRDDQGVSAFLQIRWQFERPRRLTVSLSVSLGLHQALSSWTLAVRNHDPRIGPGEVVFPLLDGIGKAQPAEPDFVAVPFKAGQVYPDPIATLSRGFDLRKEQQRGSREIFAMPFSLFYVASGPGLYVAAADPELSEKMGTAVPKDGRICFGFSYPTAYMGQPRRSHTYQATVGVFTGDWYDGTLLYRRWAERQKWFPRQTFRERTDIPDWFKRCPLAIMENNQGDSKESFLNHWEMAKRLHALLGLREPVLMHWYFTWPNERDDQGQLRSYPSYAPEFAVRYWPDFRQYVEEAKRLGLVPVTYAMYRMISANSPGWDRFGEQAAIRWPNGDLLWDLHAPWNRINRWTAGCPASPELTETMVQEALRRIRDFGVKGLYADLGGCETPAVEIGGRFLGAVCWAPGHGHPPGGGSWFHQAEARLVQAILREARKVEPDFIVLGEEFHEANVGQSYTATLHQPFFSPDVWQEVPMLQVVYGRYYKLFGSKPSEIYSKPCGGAGDVLETHPRWGLDIARNLAWGDLVAWVPSYVMNAYDYPEIEEQIGWQIRPQIEFLRHAATIRRAAAKYLVFGQMLRPPPARHDAVPPARWDYSLVTSAFRADDGTVAFVFVNARFDQPLQVSFTLRPDEYGLPSDGSWALSRMEEVGKWTSVGTIQSPACEQTLALPPLRAAVLVAQPKKSNVKL